MNGRATAQGVFKAYAFFLLHTGNYGLFHWHTTKKRKEKKAQQALSELSFSMATETLRIGLE